MGSVKKLLYETQLSPKCEHYAGNFLLERCESFHVHLRNLRLALNREEWDLISDEFSKARQKWIAEGRPGGEEELRVRQIRYLFGRIHPAAGIDSDSFRIEEENTKDTIHFHYRSLRLDLSIREFQELAAGFAIASAKLSGSLAQKALASLAGFLARPTSRRSGQKETLPEETASDVSRLFGALNDSGLRYTIPWGHENLPELSAGADLDLFIHEEDSPRLQAFFSSLGYKFSERAGHKIYGKCPRKHFAAKYRSVRLDIWPHFCVRGGTGRVVISRAITDKLYEGPARHRESIRIPDPVPAATINFLRAYCDKGFEGKYQERLSSVSRDPALRQRVLDMLKEIVDAHPELDIDPLKAMERCLDGM